MQGTILKVIIQGNARYIPLADESVQCVVTSPPYFGLRDYGIAPSIWGGREDCGHEWADASWKPSRWGDKDKENYNSLTTIDQTGFRGTVREAATCSLCSAWRGTLGLEPTPELYIHHIVEVFREVRRVLRKDGTCWVNLGDSYNAGTNATRKNSTNGAVGNWQTADETGGLRRDVSGLKPKDLVGIPWSVAKALQAPYYTGKIKDEKDRVWLAATIDAEGTICGFTHKRKDNGRIRRGLHIAVTNSNVLMLDRCYKIWQTSKHDHNPHGIGHYGKLDTFRWIAHGLDNKAALLAELYPYFLCKKKQALLAWNFIKLTQECCGIRARGKNGDGNREKLSWIVHSLSRLNHLESVDIPDWIDEPNSMYEPGWWLRSDIIWSKPNPMPESVTDRPTKSHEYLFLLAKSEKYYYDNEAIRETIAESQEGRIRNDVIGGTSWKERQQHGKGGTFARGKASGPLALLGQYSNGAGQEGTSREALREGPEVARQDEQATWERLGYRNKRTVWTVATQPYPDAHFASFPEDLIKPCILAGTSARGCCAECGAPWERVTEVKSRQDQEAWSGAGRANGCQAGGGHFGRTGQWSSESKTLGWQPTCTHNADTRACIVLDPFAGSGTTIKVAQDLGRVGIGLEIKAEYINMAKVRAAQQGLRL